MLVGELNYFLCLNLASSKSALKTGDQSWVTEKYPNKPSR